MRCIKLAMLGILSLLVSANNPDGLDEIDDSDLMRGHPVSPKNFMEKDPMDALGREGDHRFLGEIFPRTDKRAKEGKTLNKKCSKFEEDFTIVPLSAVAIKSGTPFIMGPDDEVKRLADAVGAQSNSIGGYTIECNALDDLPDVVFTIDGKDFTIPGKDTVIEVEVGTCLFAFGQNADPAPPLPPPPPPSPPVPFPGGPQWILGDVFMREYSVVIFDYINQKICFAKDC